MGEGILRGRRLTLLAIGAVLFNVIHCSALSSQETAPQKGEAEVPPENPFPQAIAVPEGILDGGVEWLNTSQPISMKDLRGKIVLLDFWTYCCINCMHVLPDLKYLEQKYGRQLVVIGVHSAKFDNEKLTQNIRDAILRYEIEHPVVNDSEMLIWRKFGTRAWPTLALVDPEGKYIGSQSGEGNRELFDQVIGKLVEYHRWKGTLDENPILFSQESEKTTATPLRYPGKVLADAASGRVFVADTNHNRIVVCDMNGELLDLVGSGNIGRQDGAFEQAEFDHPQGMVLIDDLLYVADTENHLLRIVDLPDRRVRTLAGTGRQGRTGRDTGGPLLTTSLNSPWSLAHANGTLFIAMAGPHQIWSHQIGDDHIAVFAGSGREDVINGAFTEAAFAQPSELTIDDSGKFLYVADSEGSAIRRLNTSSDGTVTTLAGTSELPRGQSLFAFGDVDGTADEARFQHPLGVVFASGRIYVADSYNHKIKMIDTETGLTTTWLGDGVAGKELQPARFSEPGGLAAAAGRLFIADTNNHRVCIADLETKAVSEFRIAGLTPPAPAKQSRPLPDMTPLNVPVQMVRTGEFMTVRVTLTVPEGFKRNDLTPVVWELFAETPQSIIPAEALAVRDEATVDGMSAEVRIPLTRMSGSGTFLLQLGFGFCAEDSSVCRLATAVWEIPVEVFEDAEDAPIQLAFPTPQTVDAEK